MAVTAGATYTASAYLAPRDTDVNPNSYGVLGVSWYDSDGDIIEQNVSTVAAGTAIKASCADNGTFVYTMSGNGVAVGDYVTTTGWSTTAFNVTGGKVIASSLTSITVESDDADFVGTEDDVSLTIFKSSTVPLDEPEVAVRASITLVAPEDAASARLSINMFAPKNIILGLPEPELFIDSVLFEQSGVVRPYFDGSMGTLEGFSIDNSYLNADDVSWDANGDETGKSYYYLNRDLIYKRLLEVIPDYLPHNAPWTLTLAS
jgi:hypothetical protein